MSALNERQVQIVRTLVQTAPDRVLRSLAEALSGTPNGSAIGQVRLLVERETIDRNLRNFVLAPIAPMCVGGGDHPHRLTFPARVLPLLWQALRSAAPEEIVDLHRFASEPDSRHQMAMVCDRLAALAAESLRARTPGLFAEAAELCDQPRLAGTAALAACLDIAPVVRDAIARLPVWLAQRGGDTNAATRVAYNDAVEIADDAGPRFFEMLAAQLEHPWMVLRIISAVMDKPTERYLAESELGGFGEHVLEDVDAGLAQIAKLDIDGGPEAGRRAAEAADLIVQQVTELENNVDMHRDHGWGRRVAKQRTTLAEAVEARLRDLEKAVTEALPMQAPRSLRSHHETPRLTAPPDEVVFRRARTLLAFCDALHRTADYGGFSAARNRVIERLGAHIDRYVEEVLELMRHGQAGDPDLASAYLAHAAEFLDVLRGGRAGELVMRRAHAALNPDPASGAAA